MASPHLPTETLTDPCLPPRFPMPTPLPGSGHHECHAQNDVSCVHAPCLYPGHPPVHFDVPTAAGRQIFSVQCCGGREVTVSPPRGSSRPDQLAAARSDSGPVIAVFMGKDGEYFTDYGLPHLLQRRGIDELMHQVLSSQPRLEEKRVEDTAPAQMLQRPGPDVLSDVLQTTTLEGSSMPSTSSSYNQDSIRFRIFNDWGIRFYIRVDHRGYFHTYPHVGGPFHCLPEAYAAIDCYLRDREDPTMRIDQDDPDLIYHVLESTRERAIRRVLCWPDGTRKERLQSLPIDERRCWMLQLVRALVDKYNDDHNLLGDLAYGLKGVVRYHVFDEGSSRRMYYHINFTAKTEDCDDLLFFAEAVGEQRDVLMVSCICRVNPCDKDMGYCYGCSSRVVHPKNDSYAGGHSSAGCLSGTYRSYGPLEDLGATPAELEAEEAHVRYSYKDPVDPSFLENLRAPIEVNFSISNKDFLPPRPLEDSVAFISKFF